jgi:hypothetical protein
MGLKIPTHHQCNIGVGESNMYGCLDSTQQTFMGRSLQDVRSYLARFVQSEIKIFAVYDK